MIFLIAYSIAIVWLTLGLKKLPFSTLENNTNHQKFSIVIPFRNEEKNLNNLLNSISKLNYKFDDFEVLLINDESSDSSVEIIQKWKKKLPNIILLNNHRESNSPKKDALKVGVKHTNFDWIITTDADCIVPKNWLHFYNSTLQKHKPLLICGPVLIEKKTSILNQYQYLDNLSLMGTTMGSFGLKKPMMCNAANMGFHKKTYVRIQETFNNKITSGDDIFTLEAFVKNYPTKIQYLNHPEAIIQTKAEESLKSVIQQRIRWAAKSTHYKNIITQLLGIIVLSTQISLIITPFIQPKTGLVLWIIKMGVDFILLSLTTKTLNKTIHPLYYGVLSIAYPFINTYIGIKALFGGYTWKERSFKR